MDMWTSVDQATATLLDNHSKLTTALQWVQLSDMGDGAEEFTADLNHYNVLRLQAEEIVHAASEAAQAVLSKLPKMEDRTGRHSFTQKLNGKPIEKFALALGRAFVKHGMALKRDYESILRELHEDLTGTPSYDGLPDETSVLAAVRKQFSTRY